MERVLSLDRDFQGSKRGERFAVGSNAMESIPSGPCNIFAMLYLRLSDSAHALMIEALYTCIGHKL